MFRTRGTRVQKTMDSIWKSILGGAGWTEAEILFIRVKVKAVDIASFLPWTLSGKTRGFDMAWVEGVRKTWNQMGFISFRSPQMFAAALLATVRLVNARLAVPPPPAAVTVGAARTQAFIPDSFLAITGRETPTKRQRELCDVWQDRNKVARAVDALHQDFYAPKTWASHVSEVRFYVKACALQHVEPWPITVYTLEAFVAVLKKFTYRGIPQYVGAVFRQSRLIGMLPDPIVEDRKSMILRAARRDLGPAKQMEPVTAAMLMAIAAALRRAFQAGAVKVKTLVIFAVCVVEWFFLLRCSEARAIRCSRVRFGTAASLALKRGAKPRLFSPVEVLRMGVRPCEGAERFRVALEIASSKMDQEAKGVTRMLDCVCTEGCDVFNIFVCPVHALAFILADKKMEAQPPPTLGERHKIDTGDIIEFLRRYLKHIGIVVTDDELGQLYASHSLRRGGVQALAKAGWDLDTLRAFGRWASYIIEVYLLETPLEERGHLLAASMLSHLTGACVDGDAIRNEKKPVGPTILFKGASIMVFLVPHAAARPQGRPDGRIDVYANWIEVSVRAMPGEHTPTDIRQQDILNQATGAHDWPASSSEFLVELDVTPPVVPLLVLNLAPGGVDWRWNTPILHEIQPRSG